MTCRTAWVAISMVAVGCTAGPPGGAHEPVAADLAAAWRDWPLQSAEVELKATAGAPAPVAQRVLGGTGQDSAYDIWPLRDGGYVLTGSTTSHEGDGLDLFLVRVDASGHPLWSRVFGGDGVEIGFAVRTLSDDTIVVTGWTHSFGAGAGDFLLLGVAADGQLAFAHTFGGAAEERGTSMTVTAADELLLIGETYSHGEGDARFLLIRTDRRGRILSQQTYDSGPLHDRGLAIVATGEDLLLVGNAMDAQSGSRATVSNGLAFKVDQRTGQEHWRLEFDSGAHDIFHHAAALSGGRYLLTGYTRGLGASGENDMLLLPVDADGRRGEPTLLGGRGADHNIIARADERGGVLLAGYTTSVSAGSWDAYVARIGDDLDVAWEHAWGGLNDDGATSVVAHPAGTVAVTGYSESFGAGGRDILFFTIEP